MRLRLAGVICALILSACSNPRDTVIPSDPTAWETQLAPALKELTDEERRLLGSYMIRSKAREVFGGNAMPAGITIGAAIEEQRKAARDQEQRDAEEKALREKVERERETLTRQIQEVLTVAFVSKNYSPADFESGEYQDQLTLTFAFANKSQKSIAGFKGKARFEDMFGDEISENNISYDETIAPGATARWRGSLKYNQFMSHHVALRNTAADKIRFRFIPEVVLFTDGTKLQMPDSD